MESLNIRINAFWKRTVLLFLIWSSIQITYGQCPETVVNLNSPSQMAQFKAKYPNCDRINGNVLLEGSSISNLDLLRGFRAIDGTLTIKNTRITNLTDIQNLEELEEIEIIGNDYLESIDLPAQLGDRRMVGVNIRANSSLQNLVLNETSYDRITVCGCSSLKTVSIDAVTQTTNDILLFLNSNLESISMQNLQTIVGLNPIIVMNSVIAPSSATCNENFSSYNLIGSGLVIQNSDDFRSANFPALTRLDWLDVVSNVSLSNLHLPNLRYINSNLDINNNDNLLEQEFNSLKHVGHIINVWNNWRLTKFHTPLLDTIEADLVLWNNEVLNDLNFGQPFFEGFLGIQRNRALVNLDAFQWVETLWNLELYDNDLLTDVTGLSGFTNLLKGSNAGNIWITDNDLLTNLNGLEQVDTVSKVLWIKYNNNLDDISALDQLVIKNNNDTVYIEDNMALSTCNIQSICDYLHDGGNSSIKSNKTDCNSRQEVVDNCPTCPINITFTRQSEIDSIPILYYDCEELLGDMIIRGDDIFDIQPIQQFNKIYGSLIIDNCRSIQVIDQLAQMQVIGNLHITNNELLYTIEGLNFVHTLPGDINISNNPKLETIDGLNTILDITRNYSVVNNPFLQSIKGLRYVDSIGGDCTLKNNPFLNELVLADHVRKINGSLTIENAIGSTSNMTFSKLEKIDKNLTLSNLSVSQLPIFSKLNIVGGDLAVKQNSKLISLAALNHVSAVNGLFILEQNDTLATLEPLDSLVHLGGAHFSQNNELIEVPGLSTVKEILGSVEIIENNKLRNFALSSLDTISGGLIVLNNDSLRTVANLGNVKVLGGSLRIEENKSFNSLAGCNLMKKITGDLILKKLPALRQLNGLDGIKEIGGNLEVGILDINDCRGLCTVLDSTGIIGGSVRLDTMLNGFLCSKKAIIKSSCDGFGGVVVDNQIRYDIGRAVNKLLDSAIVEILNGDHVLYTTMTNVEGLFHIDDFFLEDSIEYILRTKHGSEPDLVVSKKVSATDLIVPIHIDYPLTIRRDLVKLHHEVKHDTIKVEFFGGGIIYKKAITAYDVQVLEKYLSDSLSQIDANHERRIESMRRQILGLKLLDEYAQDAQTVSLNLAKSEVAILKGISDILTFLGGKKGVKNKLQTKIDSLKAQAGANAATTALVDVGHATIKSMYNYTKKFYIDPYLNKMGNSEEEKAFIANIKGLLFAIDRLLDRKDLALSTFKSELIELAIQFSYYVHYKGGYIKLFSQFQVDNIIAESIEQKGTFEDAYSEAMNIRRPIKLSFDNSMDYIAALETSSSQIDDFSGVVENASIALSFSGIGSWLAPEVYAISKLFKGFSLVGGAFTLVAYGAEYALMPAFLHGNLKEVSRRSGGIKYPDGFFANQFNILSDEFQYNNQTYDVFKSVFNQPNIDEVVSKYHDINRLDESQLERMTHYLEVMSSAKEGRDTIVSDLYDTRVTLEEIAKRKLVIHMMTMAYLLDTTLVEVHTSIQQEIDSIQLFQDQLLSDLSGVMTNRNNVEFQNYIAISHVVYPDTTTDSKFTVDFELVNYGPAISDTFKMKLSPTTGMILEGSTGDSLIENIVLRSGEAYPFHFDMELLRDSIEYGMYIEIIDERSLHYNIPFVFMDDVESEYSSSSKPSVTSVNTPIIIQPTMTDDIIYIDYGEIKPEQVFIINASGYKVADIGSVTKHRVIQPNGLYYLVVQDNKEVYSVPFVKYE